jgi:two-component system, NtrC family, nitrogen regulation sensor histidine kinase NtrY
LNAKRPKSRLARFLNVPGDRKLFRLALSCLLPIGVLSLALASDLEFSRMQALILGSISVLWVVVAAFNIKAGLLYQLRTINTLIEALRTEDYSLRGSHGAESGELAELFRQINSLTEQLQKSRQDEQELRNLLERVVNQINVAIFVCDSKEVIVLANQNAARLLKKKLDELVGSSLQEAGLYPVLPTQGSHVIEHTFPTAGGRWQVRRSSFVQEGKRGDLVFITDLEQVLSEEEIKSWQRLIRVIAHEVNNSLTPVTSLCQSMEALLNRELDARSHASLLEGLNVISERAANLNAFIADYIRIAKLPEANKILFDLHTVLQRIIAIYREENIVLKQSTSEILLFGDPAQIEQVLINLTKNALEANADTGGSVEISVSVTEGYCEIQILDEGGGIVSPANLFVPFYSTKAKGAGIGLALSRKIAATHHGEIYLENRADHTGAKATLKIPLTPRP